MNNIERQGALKWAKIENYSRYEISNDGMVYDSKSDRFLIPSNNNGYLWVWVYSIEGKRYKKSIHRLVYEAFNGPIPESMEVNHKDEVKGNNNAWNLELLTKKDNCNYGSRNERIGKAHSKQVYQYTLSGALIRVWDSITAVEQANYSRTGVGECCNGHRTQFRGFIWSFDSVLQTA